MATAATSDNGLLVASNSGGVVADGSATFYGDPYTSGDTGLTGSHPLNAPIVGMAALPGGNGYYLVGKDGGVFAYGAAQFEGSTYSDGITGLNGAHPLNAPIVGIATTPHGHGYWLVAADGGVFTFGTARFYGNTYTQGLTGLSGAHPLNAPIVAIVPSPNGEGCRLFAADGGVFDFGNAAFYGSTYSDGITGLSGAHPLNAPIVGAEATPDGDGYYLVGKDGGVFDFGDAQYEGSTYSDGYTGLNSGSNPLPSPVVSISPNPSGPGYWAITQGGKLFAFGAAAALPSVLAIPQLTSNPLQNPSANMQMTFENACVTDNYDAKTTNSEGCNGAAMVDLNAGRMSEGLPALTLPSNFETLPRFEQLFVLLNEARIARGLLPIYGIASNLQGIATTAADDETDPSMTSLPVAGATGYAGGIWSEDWSTVGSMFAWMYDDGPDGVNIDCQPDNMSGCWGHRDIILNSMASGPYSEVIGVASTPDSVGMESDAAIFVQVRTSALPDISYVYTWNQAVAAGA